MSQNIFIRLSLVLLLLLNQSQVFAATAASAGSTVDTDTALCAPPSLKRGGALTSRDMEYLDSPGGGTARIEVPALDERWRWCDPAMLVRIGGKLHSFQEVHAEMEGLVSKVSKLWKEVQCSIRAKEGREIGFGNLATAAITFFVDKHSTPITIPINNITGGRLFFESGFRDTAACEAHRTGKSLNPKEKKGAPPIEAVLVALEETDATPEELFASLRPVYDEAIGKAHPFFSPELLAALRAKTEEDAASWSTAAGEGSIDFLHSEQILRLFLEKHENLIPVFTELRTKMSADATITSAATITDAILHIYTRVDMCPRCSTTTSAAIDPDLATGIFPQIFKFMRTEGFSIREDASTVLLVSSKDNPGKAATNPRRDTHGKAVLVNVTPDRPTVPIRAFHRHPEIASSVDINAIELASPTSDKAAPKSKRKGKGHAAAPSKSTGVCADTDSPLTSAKDKENKAMLTDADSKVVHLHTPPRAAAAPTRVATDRIVSAVSAASCDDKDVTTTI